MSLRDFISPDSIAETEVKRLIAEARRNGQLDTMNWFMQLCGSGATVGMIRKIVYNKFIEIAGEGEKA